jgi:hypothetical protein
MEQLTASCLLHSHIFMYCSIVSIVLVKVHSAYMGPTMQMYTLVVKQPVNLRSAMCLGSMYSADNIIRAGVKMVKITSEMHTSWAFSIRLYSRSQVNRIMN